MCDAIVSTCVFSVVFQCQCFKKCTFDFPIRQKTVRDFIFCFFGVGSKNEQDSTGQE